MTDTHTPWRSRMGDRECITCGQPWPCRDAPEPEDDDEAWPAV